jgi:hypothetical protein
MILLVRAPDQPTAIGAIFGMQEFWIIIKEWRSLGILPFGGFISLWTGFNAQRVGR